LRGGRVEDELDRDGTAASARPSALKFYFKNLQYLEIYGILQRRTPLAMGEGNFEKDSKTLLGALREKTKDLSYVLHSLVFSIAATMRRR
jgi:hypothetical protein